MVTSVYPRGLLPSGEVVDRWATIADAATWAGLEDGLLRCVLRALGDQSLNNLPLLASIPFDSIKEALNNATRGDRSLNAIERSHFVLMVNAVRVKYGAMPHSIDQPVQSAAPSAVALTGAPAASTKIKLKLSQIIDQGSDMEIEQLAHDELQRKRQKYVLIEGDAPLEKEEITDAQLSCLQAKVCQSQAPFVDMGVWGPYGDRLARAMKFTSQVLKDGQWRAVELPGATNLASWQESWRIFRTGCLMLDIASSAVLDRYAAEFRSRVSEHPNCWHLAAQADIRCRSEFWTQELRRQEAFHSAHSDMSSFSPTQPWNSVIKASANCQEFWTREFEKPAMLFQLNGPRAPRVADVFPPVPPGDPDKKRSFDPQRRDGRFFKSTQGINICYDWTRNKDGCNNEGCPKGMAHICEWCRQPHRSVDCPQVPGWKPGQDGGKKGKGRGKNGGRGKRRHM